MPLVARGLSEGFDAARTFLTLVSDDFRMDAGSLLIEWAHGWSVSRGRPMPTAVVGGVRIDVVSPGHGARYVLKTLDRALIERLRGSGTAIGVEIKTLGDSAALRAWLGDAWSSYPACKLMTSEFTRGHVPLLGAYTSRLSTDRASMVAAVLDGEGAVVSSARLVRWGPYGIVDQVATVPAHRRRGLATAVMAMLGQWAVSNGLHTGVLSATEQGAFLYGQLGWIAHGEVAGAIRTH